MIQYKTEKGLAYHDRLELEFFHRIDPRLRGILWVLDDWSVRTTGKNIIITCLNRTEEENKAVGGYKWTAHYVGRAGDLRAHLFSDIEIERLIAYAKEVWGEDFIYIVCHGEGPNRHIHININRRHHRKDYAEAA